MQKSTGQRPLNFAIVGAGFIFDRHLAAIEHIGGKLLMVCDTDETKKEKLDSDVEFYTSVNKMVVTEKFNKEVDWVVVCVPNGEHRKIMEAVIVRGKNVLCEKPLVISTKALAKIKELAERWNSKVFTVLQLRESPKLQQLKESLGNKNKIKMDLSMKRGDFYWEGWKGDPYQSGGLLFNIGVHYFDLLLWLFGRVHTYQVDNFGMKEADGKLFLEDAMVDWSISLNADKDNQYRVFEINGERLNLTRILESLHNKVYEQLLEGKGTTLEDVTPVIQLCEQMTNSYGHGGPSDKT